LSQKKFLFALLYSSELNLKFSNQIYNEKIKNL
jgi:hypothetical protein